MTRNCFLIPLMLSTLVGCEDHSFHYDYAGRLLTPDGSAAANVQLYVIDREGLEFVHGHHPEYNYSEEEHWKYWGTRTDQDGRFQAWFNFGGTYTKWFDTFPSIPPAKQLDTVYVVVRRGEEWVPILVTLDEKSQAHGSDGGRHIDLPPVTITEDK